MKESQKSLPNNSAHWPLSQIEPKELLAEFEKLNWNASSIYPQLKEPLEQLFLSYCNSQLKAGGKIQSQEIHSDSVEFLQWMETHEHWPQLKHRFYAGESSDLFLSLSRLYLSYVRQKNVQTQTEPSYASKKVLLELPQPLSIVSDEIMSALSSSTLSLDDDCRFEYQLHLEGLFVEEISFLTNQTVSEVEKKIFKAKESMKNPDHWRNVS